MGKKLHAEQSPVGCVVGEVVPRRKLGPRRDLGTQRVGRLEVRLLADAAEAAHDRHGRGTQVTGRGRRRRRRLGRGRGENKVGTLVVVPELARVGAETDAKVEAAKGLPVLAQLPRLRHLEAEVKRVEYVDDGRSLGARWKVAAVHVLVGLPRVRRPSTDISTHA